MIRPLVGRIGRLLIETFGLILAGLVVLAGLLVWRLGQGPVTVDFLTPTIERALQAAGARVEVAETVLTWGGLSRAFDLRARGVRAFGRDGRPIARVPELGISVDLRRLLHGDVAPTRFELIRPRLRVVRTAEGEFRFDVTDPADAPEPGEPSVSEGRGTDFARDLLDALEHPPGTGTGFLAELRELSVTDAILLVQDRQNGQMWRARRADIALRRHEDGVGGFALVDLQLGDGTARLTADLRRRSDDRVTIVNARLDGLRPADLASRAPALAPLSAVSLVMGGTATMRLDPAFRTSEVSLHLTGQHGALDLPERFDEPVRIDFAELRASFDAVRRRVVVDELYADFGGPAARLAATVVDLGGRRLDVRAEAEAGNVPVDRLGDFWPHGVAKGARKWILGNLSSGTVERATASLAAVVPVDAPDTAEMAALAGEIHARDVDVRYFRDLPPVTGVAGVARFDARRMDLDLDGGSLRDLAVGRSSIAITGLEGRDEHIDIEVPVAGPLTTVLDLLDMPPLGYPSRLGLDRSGAAGRADGTVTFSFPLEKGLELDDVVFGAKATLAGVALAGVAAGRPVTEGRFDLTLDPERLALDGTAELDGIPAHVSWVESLSDGAEVATRIEVAGTVGDEDRRRLGLGAEPWLSGPVGVAAQYAVPSRGAGTLTADLDLRDARLDAAPMGWGKPPGLPGTGRFELLLEKGRPVRIPAFAIETRGLDARGSIDFADDGGVRRVVLDDLRLGESRLDAEVMSRPGGGYRVALNGPLLDARPLLSRDRGGAGGAGRDEETGGIDVPLELSVQLGRIVVADGRDIADVAGMLRHDGAGWVEAVLDARVGEATPVALRFRPDGPVRRLRLETADAGAAMRALDIYDTMRGGSLLIEAEEPVGDPAAAMRGTIELTDFTLVEAPVLARLLNAASPTGFAELLGGGGIGFARLVGDWHWQGDRIRVADLRTSGAALGLTSQGQVDLGRGQFDLQGTIVPVYGLNRILGAIPLLGDLLTGGEGQGVFAFTYAIAGPFEDPRVTVNPLAVLAPGFLRNLFFLGPVPGGKAPSAPGVN